jgi:hypothetical protein
LSLTQESAKGDILQRPHKDGVGLHMSVAHAIYVLPKLSDFFPRDVLRSWFMRIFADPRCARDRYGSSKKSLSLGFK